MKLLYYPTIHERATYQFFTEKESSLKTVRNVNSLSRTWDIGTLKVIREELATGNMTLVISMFDTAEPVVITRKALPVNDLYIFDLTLAKKGYIQIFHGEEVHYEHGLCYCGFSASTVQIGQMHDPGNLSYRIEILVSRSYLLHFINELSSNEKSALSDQIEDTDDFFQMLSLSLSETQLIYRLVDMYHSNEQGAKVVRILSSNLVHEILAKLLQRLHSRNEAQSDTVQRAAFNKIMEVKKMLEARLEVKYRMEEICNYCGMSASKFKYLFKSVVGHSFSNYYTKIRMEEAARQLEDKGMETISQLSLHLGYKNLSQFTRTFKDYFNCSPSDFLKSRR